MSLSEKLSTLDQHWSPRTVAEFNGHDDMVVKTKGPSLARRAVPDLSSRC